MSFYSTWLHLPFGYFPGFVLLSQLVTQLDQSLLVVDLGSTIVVLFYWILYCSVPMLTSMDAYLNTYPILILPASNTFHFCHHAQPHHSQPYHAQSIIYHPSFIINGNSRYRAYSAIISIFPIFSRLPSPLRPPLNSVK